jgi:hypothetical protein
MVESQPSKLLVAGSIPVSRSTARQGRGASGTAAIEQAGVAQLVEHLICNCPVTNNLKQY